MSESIERPHSRAQKLAYLVAISAIFLLICTFLQWKSGAYSNDLAGNDDEPAHVVSGLMAHDYVEHLLRPGNSHWPSTPRAFAEDYYVHYPKVAIGHWPPLFYLVEAVWMFVFGRTKAALLALMAVTMAGTASILFQLTRKIAGEIAAFVLAAGFLLLPISQESVESVMQDGLLALLFLRSYDCRRQGSREQTRGVGPFLAAYHCRNVGEWPGRGVIACVVDRHTVGSENGCAQAPGILDCHRAGIVSGSAVVSL